MNRMGARVKPSPALPAGKLAPITELSWRERGLVILKNESTAGRSTAVA
jgi:hypothetical protein